MRTHILDTQIRRSCAKQVTKRKIHSHVTREPQVALDASNRADFYLRISPYTKLNTFKSPSLSILPQMWLKRNPSSLGKRRISGTLTCPKSPGRSPLKKANLKYAWSRVIANLSIAFSACRNFPSKCKYNCVSLSTKNRVACVGVNRACNCSAVTSLKRFFTDLSAAGLPRPRRLSDSPSRPREWKMARSLSI